MGGGRGDLDLKSTNKHLISGSRLKIKSIALLEKEDDLNTSHLILHKNLPFNSSSGITSCTFLYCFSTNTNKQKTMSQPK